MLSVVMIIIIDYYITDSQIYSIWSYQDCPIMLCRSWYADGRLPAIWSYTIGLRWISTEFQSLPQSIRLESDSWQTTLSLFFHVTGFVGKYPPTCIMTVVGGIIVWYWYLVLLLHFIAMLASVCMWEEVKESYRHRHAYSMMSYLILSAFLARAKDSIRLSPV